MTSTDDVRVTCFPCDETIMTYNGDSFPWIQHCRTGKHKYRRDRDEGIFGDSFYEFERMPKS